MVKPAVWADYDNRAWWYDENGDNYKIGCGVLDGMPTDTDYTLATGEPVDCLHMWFNNHAYIPGEKTLPGHMLQPETECILLNGYHNPHMNHPWMAPGSANIFSPCGVMGGLPNGCNEDGEGYFGQVCNDCNCGCSCGAFAMGGRAEQYDWPQAPTTQMKAGSIEEVAWYIGQANHAGGYQYRLCKTPEGGISELTEECFQMNPLDFVGDKQWIVYEKDRYTNYRTEIDAKRTTEGTYPLGSMWTALDLIPINEEGGDFNLTAGHIIDNIQIPSSLEPGKYVMSMRYDCKCTPEVFAFCANVEITN